MSDSSFDLPDTKNDALRALIGTIERELATLDRPLPADGAADPLKAAWAELVTQLDVGPVLATQTCPTCKRLSRVGATLCFYCWSSLRVVPQ